MVLLATCTKCREDIHIDPTEKKIMCKHCFTPFVFERTMFNADMAAEAQIRSEKVTRYKVRITELEKEAEELYEIKKELLEIAGSGIFSMRKKLKELINTSPVINKKLASYDEKIERYEAEIKELMS